MSEERTSSLSKRPTNMDHKIPYVDIISEAIFASPNRRLTAKEIFDFVAAKFGPMKSAETLKNTIRHTLSRYKIFQKVQRGRQKKPNWWTVEEADEPTVDTQIQDLQNDTASMGHGRMVPAAVIRSEPNPTVQNQQQHWEVAGGQYTSQSEQSYWLQSNPVYQFHQPPFITMPPQPQHYETAYLGQMEPVRVGNEETEYQSEYRLWQLDNACVQGISGYVENTSQYEYSFQWQEMFMSDSSMLEGTSGYTSTTSPVPQYYQM